MKTLKNCLDLKIISFVKNVVSANPNMVTWVDEEKREIYIEIGKGIQNTILMEPNKETFSKCVNIIRGEIKSRSDKSERYGLWECCDKNQEFDSLMKENIIASRSNIVSKSKPYKNVNLIKEMCNNYKANILKETLMLNEIMLSDKDQTKNFRECAIIGGLII